MTQEEVMTFLDKHQGVYFDAQDIHKIINHINFYTLHKSLKKIIKREEYEMRTVYINNRFRPTYGRR